MAAGGSGTISRRRSGARPIVREKPHYVNARAHRPRSAAFSEPSSWHSARSTRCGPTGSPASRSNSTPSAASARGTRSNPPSEGHTHPRHRRRNRAVRRRRLPEHLTDGARPLAGTGLARWLAVLPFRARESRRRRRFAPFTRCVPGATLSSGTARLPEGSSIPLCRRATPGCLRDVVPLCRRALSDCSSELRPSVYRAEDAILWLSVVYGENLSHTVRY